MEYTNTQWLLDKRPKGMPEDNCWKINKEVITSLDKNEILIEVKYLSIDPYMRGRMNDSSSYAEPAKIGDPMTGETVGVVVESNSDLYQIGDKVCAHQGWQTHIKSKDTEPSLFKVPNSDIPLSSYLGTVGMPGRTAYFGFNKVGKPVSGETVVVSAASGAVGTVVGQLAKLQGCHVIGVAGGDEKCSYVKDVLGFDECVDYKAGNVMDDLKNACPNGIDIYFENVGGEDLVSTYSEKLLGLHINADFVWSTHIDKLRIELKKRTGLLRRIQKRVPKEKIVIIAEAIFNSLLRYGVAVFLKPVYDKEDLKMKKLTKDTTTLQTLQNSMLRVIFWP